VPVVEDFLEEAADADVIVLVVGADAEFGADAEIFGEDGAGYVRDGQGGAEIFGGDVGADRGFDWGGDFGAPFSVDGARGYGLGEAGLVGGGEQDGAGDADGGGVVVGHEEETEVGGGLGEVEVVAERGLFDGGVAVEDFGGAGRGLGGCGRGRCRWRATRVMRGRSEWCRAMRRTR
jgi:hypothetical protein